MSDYFVLTKSPYVLKEKNIKELLSRQGLIVPELGRKLSFEVTRGTAILVNTADVLETCKALKNKGSRVFGLSGTDYLANEEAFDKIKVIEELPYEKTTYLVYVSAAGSKTIYTKFENIAKDRGKKVTKILGSEEVFVSELKEATIASLTTGGSLNENLSLGLPKEYNISNLEKRLKEKSYEFEVLFECKAVYFEYLGEKLKGGDE